MRLIGKDGVVENRMNSHCFDMGLPKCGIHGVVPLAVYKPDFEYKSNKETSLRY